MRLKDKVTLITGAGSGIGEATAKLFAREGATVVVADLNGEAAERVTAEIEQAGGRAVPVRADVTRNADVEAMVTRALDAFSHIDVLFNNAGVSCVGALHETSEEDWDRVMTVNVKGVYLPSRHVVPVMIRQGGGCVINMSSCIAQIGLPHRAAYTASKGAVLSLTRSMQADYARYRIRVNALLPGTIHTPFVDDYLRRHYADRIEQALVDFGKRQLTGTLGTPEDVANAALFLASDEAAFVLGAGLVIDGGVTAAKV